MTQILDCIVCHKDSSELNQDQLCGKCIRKYKITNFDPILLNALSESVISVRTTYSCPQCCMNKRFIHFCDHHQYCSQCQQFVCSDSCGQTYSDLFLCHNCNEENQIDTLGGEEAISRCELCFRNIDSRLENHEKHSCKCKFCSKTVCSRCLVQNREQQDTCVCCYQDLLEQELANRNIFQKAWKFIFPDFKA